MFKTRGGGQRAFEQCSKKLHFWYLMASLSPLWPPASIPRRDSLVRRDSPIHSAGVLSLRRIALFSLKQDSPIRRDSSFSSPRVLTSQQQQCFIISQIASHMVQYIHKFKEKAHPPSIRIVLFVTTIVLIITIYSYHHRHQINDHQMPKHSNRELMQKQKMRSDVSSTKKLIKLS